MTAKEIGDDLAFPAPETDNHYRISGMTLRQYLIGQALAGGCRPEQAIGRVDDVLAELARESQ